MYGNIAINGFGRIGRMVCRRIMAQRQLNLIAINASYDSATLAHLLKYDTVHGRFPGTVEAEAGALIINGHRVLIVTERNPAKLPWANLNIDLVIEATGKFTSRSLASAHLQSGARRVLITTASDDADLMVVMGVNEGNYHPDQHQVVSAASCTTNCLAPVAKVIHESFGIVSGLMTTIHSYTNDQNLLDNPHKDLRRARGGAMAIIPTKTGAATAVAQVLPEMAGRLNGFALRVPTPDVSIVDLVAHVERPASVAEVNAALQAAADGPMKGILGFTMEPLVSADWIGDERSAIVDGLCTMVGPAGMIKVVAWYDNEWGYSCRVADLAAHMVFKGRLCGVAAD